MYFSPEDDFAEKKGNLPDSMVLLCTIIFLIFFLSINIFSPLRLYESIIVNFILLQNISTLFCFGKRFVYYAEVFKCW